MKILIRSLLVAAIVQGSSLGCSAGPIDEAEAAAWPADVRADYRVFALRCSKCHSLARPLNSGIDDDEYWKRYVERMRRQPASGISVADTLPILRFLHVYSVEQRRKKAQALDGLSEPDAAASGPALSTGGLH